MVFKLHRSIIFFSLAFQFLEGVSAQNTLSKFFNSATSKNDYANCAKLTSDGGVIISGSMEDTSGAHHSDGFLLKLDSLYSVSWAKAYDLGSNDFIYSIDITDDNGFLLIGASDAGLFVSEGILIIRTDSLGNVLWSKTYEGSEADSYSRTYDNGYVITGSILHYSIDSTSVYTVINVMKIDGLGNLIWSNSYSASDIEYGFSIAETIDHGYVVTGQTSSFGVNVNAIFLLRTDNLGNILWAKTYDTGNSDGGLSVVSNLDGSFVVGGTIANGVSFLMKVDSDGQIIWNKRYEPVVFGIIMGSSHAQRIVSTIDGGFAFIQNDYYKNYLMKTDSNGNFEWGKRFRDTIPWNISGSYTYSILQLNYSEFTLVLSAKNNNNSDIYVVKTTNIPDSCSDYWTGCIFGDDSIYVQEVNFDKNSLSQQSNVVVSTYDLFFTDSILCSQNITLDINDLITSNSFSLSPNPASNYFTISLSNHKKDEVTVADIAGKIIYTNTIKETPQLEINTSTFSEGVYIVQVKSDEFVFTKKVFIVH
jgi:hypothetical protein